jgi:ABC-type polysaccharide transport system permease subunit
VHAILILSFITGYANEVIFGKFSFVPNIHKNEWLGLYGSLGTTEQGAK